MKIFIFHFEKSAYFPIPWKSIRLTIKMFRKDILVTGLCLMIEIAYHTSLYNCDAFKLT